MAATKNPLQDLWGRKGQDDRPAKPQASGGSVISTRSRAVEDRTAVEKEATSRMAPGHKGRPDDAACAQVHLLEAKDCCRLAEGPLEQSHTGVVAHKTAFLTSRRSKREILHAL